MRLRSELQALWLLLSGNAKHSLDEVVTACSRLRSLRSAAGRALLKAWEGERVDIGIDDDWLTEMLEQIRGSVQVYEVEAVAFGRVPKAMLGWWTPIDLVSQFLSSDDVAAEISDPEEDAES